MDNSITPSGIPEIPESYDVCSLKKEINTLLWTNGPSSLRFSEAEDRAIEILNIIKRTPEQ